MLEKHPELIEVVGEAGDGRTALSQFRSLAPDVVFLDVQMPPPNGLEVAAELADESDPPWVVFLTAFGEHALKAFELDALDYLVKPVSAERLQSTLQRLREHSRDSEEWREAASETLQKSLPAAQPMERVALLEEVTENRLIVPIEKIDLFFSREERCYALTEGKEYLLQNTLSRLEASLPAAQFFRAHRCFIVNLTRIHQVVPWFNGAYNIRMQDGTEVPLTRRKVAAFKERVEWL
jgi:DNA-binding LytR/AlgR family response regulator